MNTIEMQSITAIAHLRSAILYFMDLSEQCGYSVEAQINLYKSIKPLFSGKLVFIVINKVTSSTRPPGTPIPLQLLTQLYRSTSSGPKILTQRLKPPCREC